jgi:hypothetical protein
MNFNILFLILAFVFIVHNIEEWLKYEDLMRIAHKMAHKKVNPKLIDRFVFGTALIILSLVVFTISIIELILYPHFVMIFTKIIIFSVFFNAIWHCIVSILEKRLIPGTISALTLIIPISLLLIYMMFNDLGDTFFNLIIYIIFAMLVVPISIYTSLYIGYIAKLFISK